MSYNNPFTFRAPFKPPSARPGAAPMRLRPMDHHFGASWCQYEQGMPVDLNLLSPTQEEGSVSEVLGSSFLPLNHPHGHRHDALPSASQEGTLSTRLSTSAALLSVGASHAGEYVPFIENDDETHLPSSVNEESQEATARKGRKGGRKANEKQTASKGKKTATGRFFWDLRAQVILLECKKQYDDKRSSADLYQKIKTNEEQWIDIVGICSSRGLVVDWQQAYEKHKRLSMAYREIRDWERNTPSGKDSYWCMTPADRFAEGRFALCNFPIELFELMDRLFGLDKSVNPTATFIDTSNGLPGQRSTESPRVGETPSEAASFDKTPTNGGMEKKTRKRTHTFDVGLAEATKDLMRGWEVAEEGKKERHEKFMEVQQTQHGELTRLEQQKLEISMLFANGIQVMATTMNKMAEKL